MQKQNNFTKNAFKIFLKRNILLSEDSVVKICDMGFCKISKNSLRANSFAETRSYMSPEIFNSLFDKNIRYSTKTDIWCDLY